jgi:hypothetical protein
LSWTPTKIPRTVFTPLIDALTPRSMSEKPLRTDAIAAFERSSAVMM